VGATAPVPNAAGLVKPERTVPGPCANQCVRYFVQQHLFNLSLGPCSTEVSRKSDAVATMIALAKPCRGVIPAKKPGRIESVHSKKVLCVGLNPGVLCHGGIVASGDGESRALHTGCGR